jgi:hypothetical protein
LTGSFVQEPPHDSRAACDPISGCVEPVPPPLMQRLSQAHQSAAARVVAMAVCDNLAIEEGMVPRCNLRSRPFGQWTVGAWECASGGYQPACLCSACMARPAHG